MAACFRGSVPAAALVPFHALFSSSPQPLCALGCLPRGTTHSRNSPATLSHVCPSHAWRHHCPPYRDFRGVRRGPNLRPSPTPLFFTPVFHVHGGENTHKTHSAAIFGPITAAGGRTPLFDTSLSLILGVSAARRPVFSGKSTPKLSWGPLPPRRPHFFCSPFLPFFRLPPHFRLVFSSSTPFLLHFRQVFSFSPEIKFLNTHLGPLQLVSA